MFNAYPRRGFQENGMVRGAGQQNGMSPYLDQPEPEPRPDLYKRADPVGGVDDPRRQHARLIAALQQPMPPELPQETPRFVPGGFNPVSTALRWGQQDGPGFKSGEGRTFGGRDVNGTMPVGARIPIGNDVRPPQDARVGPGIPIGNDLRPAQDAIAAPSTPGVRGANWNAGTRPAGGYEPDKWGTQNSVKYIATEILSRYPATPSGLKQAMQDPDFKAQFPDAQLVGHDKIDFGSTLSDFTSGVPVGIVDVGEAFDETNDTGKGWWWGAPGSGSAASGGAAGYGAPAQANGQSNLMRALGFGDGSIDINQLLQQLLAENAR